MTNKQVFWLNVVCAIFNASIWVAKGDFVSLTIGALNICAAIMLGIEIYE